MSHPIVATPRQADFLAIPETPLVYWLRPRFFSLLQSERRLRDVAEVKQGLATADNERFTRCFWEVDSFGEVRDGKPISGRWFWYAKGGRYQKWAGLEWLVVDWENDGQRIKGCLDPRTGRPYSNVWMLRDTERRFFFRTALTSTLVARGSMGLRLLNGAIFGHTCPTIFVPSDQTYNVPQIGALLSTRTISYLLRAVTQDLKFHEGYIASLPLTSRPINPLASVGVSCVALKQRLVAHDPLERGYTALALELCSARSVFQNWQSVQEERHAFQALLHTLEALDERLVCDVYQLGEDDVRAVLDETGTPAGWYPLISGFDAVPPLPAGLSVPSDPMALLPTHERRALATDELARLKAGLRALYGAGPGAKIEAEEEAASSSEDEVDRQVALGARILIPPETFLEELSQKLEIHPISVYWLLKELREQEGLVSPPLVKQALEDYVSITILRLLGYRWPEQDNYEREHGPILDPALVDQDGIIPLVPCGDQRTALERVRMRLEREFGSEGAEQSEREFRQWVGRDLDDWLRRDFFKRHVQQFKQRPIAWHLVSPERTFEAFVLYHKLSRATLQKLRAQYAGGLIAQLRAEQERARQRAAVTEVSRLQLQIEDVEEFRARLERIERGDGLQYRVRCRWKGEEESGRPGPYAPDIDDGVKANIRPFQEAGLLAVKEVIKKW